MRRPRPAPSRLPVDLLALDTSVALTVVADWLDDCDTHLSLAQPGGLPTAPFDFMAAFVVVQSAADAFAATLPPQTVPARDLAAVMADLASQEWFEPLEIAA